MPEESPAIKFDELKQVTDPESKFATLGDIISAFLQPAFVIAGLILLLYFLWGGFSLMASKGDPKAVESARNKITNSIVGFVIIIVAFFLMQIIGAIFGIEQFKNIFGGSP